MDVITHDLMIDKYIHDLVNGHLLLAFLAKLRAQLFTKHIDQTILVYQFIVDLTKICPMNDLVQLAFASGMILYLRVCSIQNRKDSTVSLKPPKPYSLLLAMFRLI